MQSPSHSPSGSTPVLVGVGTATQSMGVADLLVAASVAAADDAGSPALLSHVDRIALPQGSWSLTDPARTVAQRIGATRARTYRYEVGVSQQEMINHALGAIASGEAGVVLVVGGEARAFGRAGGHEVDDVTHPPDVTITRPPDFVAPVEIAAGIVWPPVQQYALIDTALAHHEHQDPSSHRNDIARLWARFNQVAQGNPSAAFPTPRSAADIATPGPKNRPLASPYNLWHSSQWTVDEADALLLCSAAKAREAGVPSDRWVLPRLALHVSESVTLTARRDLHAWPAMEVLGRAATERLGRPLADIAIADVYSCFPAAVRVQQRSLGLDPEGTPTVTGGMTFAGGPFNNYVLSSTAAVARLLRQRPDEVGLVTTVSGMLSKPGLAVWSCTTEAGAAPLVADLAEQALAATPTCPVADPESAQGPATVRSFTVTCAPEDPLQPARVAIVADLGDGRRTAATCDDASIARHALAEGLIGHTVSIARTTFVL